MRSRSRTRAGRARSSAQPSTWTRPGRGTAPPRAPAVREATTGAVRTGTATGITARDTDLTDDHGPAGGDGQAEPLRLLLADYHGQFQAQRGIDEQPRIGERALGDRGRHHADEPLLPVDHEERRPVRAQLELRAEGARLRDESDLHH